MASSAGTPHFFAASLNVLRADFWAVFHVSRAERADFLNVSHAALMAVRRADISVLDHAVASDDPRVANAVVMLAENAAQAD